MTTNERNMVNETWAAILMSLTALLTAWSAYQANLWTGNQAVDLADALDTQTILTQDFIVANERRMMDGLITLDILKSAAEGETKLNDFVVSHLREEIRKPFADWLALDPLHNKDAPAQPILMPEYLEKVTNKSKQHQLELSKEIASHMKNAQQAGQVSDNYVLLTVLFAVVLFFGGIASTFKIVRVQRVLLGIASSVMLISIWILSCLSIATG